MYPPFPVVKGAFAGADFKDGVDVRYVKNLKPASSFFIFDSEYSFMAGYDDSREMGTVHVADHFLSPGKKFFTWGRADYGTAWQKNLTDEDGDYIEIMTGCFTDNQPDFTWIMPYETKTFEQRWYSLNGIRDLKNATADGALGAYREDGGMTVTFNVTRPGAVTLDVNGLRTAYDAVPGTAYLYHAEHVKEVDEAVIRLTDETGRELVCWEKLPMFFDGKKVPEPRKRALPPDQIGSVDELWINGMHLEQYKHAVMKASDYYEEGLRRDPGDLRCNVAMGALKYRASDYEKAAEYLERAVSRAVSRNPNPIDAECYYQLGLAYRQLGGNDDPVLPGFRKKALAAFKRAAWAYAWKSAALQQAAELECAAGDLETALTDLDASLETNAHSLRAQALRSAILLRRGDRDVPRARAAEMLLYDPLDAASLFTLCLCGDESAGQKLVSILGQKTGAYLNLAEIYLSSGLYEEGLKALELCPNRTALLCFYQAWADARLGRAEGFARRVREGEAAPQESVFPNSAFDFLVLQYVSQNSESALAPYYLGCLLYARDNEKPAAACWQLSVQRNPGFADAHRALAQALFECLHDAEGAKREMELALRCSGEPRIFYESYQLEKALGASGDTLLKMLEDHPELVEKRQDLKLQYIERLCRAGRIDDAMEHLKTGTFYSYEGGEGLLPGLHAFAYIAKGVQLLKEGKKEEALAHFLYADEYPEHYHEGSRYQERRAHIHYFKALGYEAVGEEDKAREELLTAAGQYDSQGESQFFKGLALRKLGESEQADSLFRDLKKQAEGMLKSDTLNYFLGFPAALPFEQSQRRTIERMGYAALFFAQLGSHETDASKETARLMQEKGISTYWVDYLSARLA